MARVVSTQSGVCTVASATLSGTATLSPAMDTGHTIVMMSYAVNNASPGLSMFSAQLTDSTTITFTRITSASAPATSIRWTALQFDSSVVVQQSVQSWDGTATTLSWTSMSAMSDTSHCLAYSTGRGTGTQYGCDDDLASCEIISTTRVDLVCNSAPANTRRDVVTLVEFTDGLVTTQAGTLAFASGDSSQAATVSSYTASQSWLLSSQNCALGTLNSIGQKMLDGVFTNSTTVTFSRSTTGSALNVKWQLISHADATTTQTASVAFGTTDTTISTAISAVEIARSVVVACGVWHCGGKANYTADDNPFVSGSCALSFSDTTHVAATRALSGSIAATVTFYAVQFEGYYPPELTLSRRQLLRDI